MHVDNTPSHDRLSPTYGGDAMQVIDKRGLGQARTSLRKYLKQFEDEPVNHPLGPPDLSFQPEFNGVPRHLVDKFWEIMLKEGIVARHPFGGWMHPRFCVWAPPGSIR